MKGKSKLMFAKLFTSFLLYVIWVENFHNKFSNYNEDFLCCEILFQFKFAIVYLHELGKCAHINVNLDRAEQKRIEKEKEYSMIH